MPTRDDVRGWSAQQRAGVAQLLAEHIDQSPATTRSPGRRRLVLSVGGIGSLLLLPWLVFLSLTLPDHSSGGAWRAVWVGFDVALVAAFVATVLTVWFRRQVAVIGLVITSTLLTCDAWFDVCLSWGTAEHGGSIATAMVELPVAILLATSAALLMRRSFTVIARLRGQDPTPAPLWNSRTARLLVAGQFALIGILVLLPGRHDWPVPAALAVASTVATVVGLVVMVISAMGLGRGLTATPLPNAHAQLRTGGLYRYARHPIYSGLLLTMTSITVASGSLFRLLALGVLILLITVKARWEEKRLTQRFEGYASYAARTPRLLPVRLRRS